MNQTKIVTLRLLAALVLVAALAPTAGARQRNRLRQLRS